MQESKALIRVQQISVLYLVIWTISPFMEIDNIWRIGALAAFGLWLICAMSRGLHLEKIHMLAFAFIALVVVVNIIENNGFGKIMRPISLYMMVLLFIAGHFYKDKWKEIYFIVPIVLLVLIYFNFKSAFKVMEDPTIARLLIRNDEEIYQYLREGIGGYSLIYPQVVCFPVLLMWIFKSYKKRKIYLLIGLVWLVSYVLFVLNANYSIAITGSVISLIILLFYKGHSAALAFAVSAGLFIALMLMILYWDSFRNMLLEFFDGTAVAKKINDLVATSESGAAEGSINARIIRYQSDINTIFHFPFIGGLWWESGGGHSALGGLFAQYGIFGGYLFCKIIYGVPLSYKKYFGYKKIQQIANANLVGLLFVTLLDSMTYSFLGMILIITPILYENIIEWDDLTANNENTLKIEKEEVENVSVTLPKTT